MIKVDGLPYWRLSGFYFFYFLTLGGFIPYWTLYLKSIDISPEEIGILSAIVVITKIFSSLIWGWIVDYTGKHMQVIRYTSLFSMLSFFLVLFFQNFWALFIILFIFSIFWSAALPQIEATTLSHLDKASDNYTVIRIWGSISFMISALFLGEYFDRQPIEHLLPVLMITLFLVWLHSLFMPEIIRNDDGYDNQSFLTVVMKPAVISLLLVCFLVQAAHGPYYTFFSIYLETHHYSSRFIGIAWTIGVLAEVIIYVFIHKIIREDSLKHLMILTLILATLRWLMIAWFVEYVFILLLAQCLHAITFGVYHAVAIQYIHKEFKGIHQGRGQALYSSISFGAGLAFGSFFSGYLWNAVGSSHIYLFAALLSVIGIIVAHFGLKNINAPIMDRV